MLSRISTDNAVQNLFPKVYIVILILAVMASALPAASAEKAAVTEQTAAYGVRTQAYFKGREAGWFWYLEELKKEMDREKKEVEGKVQPTPREKGLEEMTTDELKAYSEAKLKDALNEPADMGKVRDYMLVQKYILDKAQVFANTWQQALLLSPDLDWTIEHPVSAAGLDIYKKEQEKRVSEVIRWVASAGGLFFFYEASCPYCQEQARILKTVEYMYGMTIFPISLDGGALPEFPAYRKDNGMAQRLGITRMPSVILALPPRDLVPISSGIVTLTEIKQRIYDIITNPALFQRALVKQ